MKLTFLLSFCVVCASAFTSCKKKETTRPAASFPVETAITPEGSTETYAVDLIHAGPNGPVALFHVTSNGASRQYYSAYAKVQHDGTFDFRPHLFQSQQSGYTSAVVYNSATGSIITAVAQKTSATSTQLFFYKEECNSIVQAAMNTIAQETEITKLVAVPGGYLLMGAVFTDGFRDVLLLKLDDNFNVLWQKNYGGEDNDMAMDAAKLCDGRWGILAYTNSFGQGDRDIWLLTVDITSGDTIHTRTYGGAGYEEPQQILADSKCNVYIAGHSASFGNPEHNGYILRAFFAGTKIWEKTYGNDHHDGFMALALLPGNQGLLAAGRTMPADGMPEDIYLQAIDFDGNELWRKTFGNPADNENPVALLTDNEYYYLLFNRTDMAGKNTAYFYKDKW